MPKQHFTLSQGLFFVVHQSLLIQLLIQSSLPGYLSIFKRSERSGAKVFALQIHHLSGFSSVIETSRILTLHLTISCQLIELSRGCTCNRCSCRCVNKASLIEHKQQGHSRIRRRPLCFSISFNVIVLDWLTLRRSWVMTWQGNGAPTQPEL